MEPGQQRKAGILMPVYALPGPEGGGTFGPESYAFIDFLAAAGQRIWQILPLVPTGREYSPYRGLSAFGGNPVFISLATLADKGWLHDDELPKAAAKSHRFDFRSSMEVKMPLLKVAFDRFSSGHKTAETRKYQRFCHTHKYWLDNLAQFLVLADREGSTDWTTWDPALRDRDANAMDAFSRQYSVDIEFQKFVQYLFLEQWLAVKHYALSQQVDIFGDLPIFVDHESADVWAYPHLFSLDGNRRPKEVAGVPPDYFSETGQLWGNPVYNWKQHKEEGFKWWLGRMTWNTLLFDTVRIDHFRGFEAYWSVPNGSADATKGRWVKAPGRQFLRKLRAQLGMGCFVAEDLGYITPEVEYLRDKFGLPGMRVLQFAFDGKQDNIHLPHNHIPNCVAYTGTHDNDTIVGWHRHLKAGKKKMVKSYIRSDGSDIAWDMIRTAWASPAKTAITTMQDLLELDSEARTNFPGKPGPNWTWRLTETKHLHKIGRRLVELSTLYGR